MIIEMRFTSFDHLWFLRKRVDLPPKMVVWVDLPKKVVDELNISMF